MKKLLFIALLTSLFASLNAQTDSVKQAIDNNIHRRYVNTDTITPERLNAVLTILNNKATTINNKVVALVGTYDSSTVYLYSGASGVTPALAPPSISHIAVNSAGEWYMFKSGSWQYQFTVITNNAQTWSGDKTLNGKFTANGVSSNGSSNTAALTTNGVVSQKDTVVNSDFTLTGAYGVVGVNCSDGVKSITLPYTFNTVDWVYTIRKQDNSSNSLLIKTATGLVILTILNKYSVIFKNISGTWSRIF